MTTITTTHSGPNADHGTAPRASERGASFRVATRQAARRTVLQYLRSPQLLILPNVVGALFLFIFRYVFGGAIDVGDQGVDYVDFLIPGFLVQTILWAGMNAPAGVAEDAATGVYDRFRSLPIPRAAIVTGRSLADNALYLFALFVTAMLGLAVGFRTHADAASVLAAVGVMVLVSYAFTWVFISLGLSAPNAQAAQGMATLLIVPLTFVSSAFVPVSSMPGWMQPFAEHQPLTVMSNAVRSLMLGGTDAAGIGHTTPYWVLLSVIWCVGIGAMFAALAVARFARTR